MCVITMKGVDHNTGKGLYEPLSLEISLAGLHKTQLSVCDSKVSFVLSAAGLTSYYDTPTSRPRAHDIISMDISIEEQNKILHTK